MVFEEENREYCLCHFLFQAEKEQGQALDCKGHWIRIYEKQQEGRGLGSSGMRMH